jgi:hypothetical protein
MQQAKPSSISFNLYNKLLTKYNELIDENKKLAIENRRLAPYARVAEIRHPATCFAVYRSFVFNANFPYLALISQDKELEESFLRLNGPDYKFQLVQLYKAWRPYGVARIWETFKMQNSKDIDFCPEYDIWFDWWGTEDELIKSLEYIAERGDLRAQPAQIPKAALAIGDRRSSISAVQAKTRAAMTLTAAQLAALKDGEVP